MNRLTKAASRSTCYQQNFRSMSMADILTMRHSHRIRCWRLIPAISPLFLSCSWWCRDSAIASAFSRRSHPVSGSFLQVGRGSLQDAARVWRRAFHRPTSGELPAPRRGSHDVGPRPRLPVWPGAGRHVPRATVPRAARVA